MAWRSVTNVGNVELSVIAAAHGTAVAAVATGGKAHRGAVSSTTAAAGGARVESRLSFAVLLRY